MRAVRRGAGARAGRHRRQLLRARRRQHHVDPAGEPGAQGGAGDHAAGGVPASDRRGAGRRGAASCRRPQRRCPTSPSARLPATPIMRWLAERGGPIERFNQAMLLQVPAGLREEHLVAALQALLDHHDALRLRLAGSRDRRPSGPWRSHRPVPVPAGECLHRVDVAGLDEAALRAAHQRAGAAAELRLAPSAGTMVQAVWFDAGAAAHRPAAADHPPSGGRRGVVAHPGAGPGGGLGGDCARGRAVAAAARHLVPALGAAACGARAGAGAASTSFRSGPGC